MLMNLCGTNNFLKRKLKIFIIDVSFGKKKVVSKRGMTAVLIMHFFFVTFSQNSHWSHNFLCQKGEDSQSNENDDQSNRNFPTVDIATLTKRVTHFVLYISV